GLACSIKTVRFNTTNETEGIQIKVEVLNKSSINESELDFSKASVYQYLDISFNNKTLVNEESKNRSIEFRVLNELKGGSLIVNTVYLKHRRTQKWESYKPELLGTDKNYSYFIVRNISGFSPFAVICNYKYGSATSNLKENGDRGLPAYLKRLLFQQNAENIEQDSESEISEISASEKTAISENKAKSLDQEAEFNKKNINESREGRAQSADSNKLRGIGISLLFLIVVLFFLFRKKKDNDK
ncbi:MAG: PGF-pre-PGF domain-containing protein, partial [Methanosarcinaceae archaeon]|nr:PGF-pre-PGF domain-containing protein [Methanosarcinaceae archaeon]